MTEAVPFDVAIAADGTAWVSNTGGLPFGEHPSSVAKYALVNGVLEQQFLRFLGAADLGACPSILAETHGSLLRVTSLVYAIRPDGTEIGHFNGGGMDGPWDTAIDGEDNVWVANFGPLESGPPFTGRLTKLWGVNAPPGQNVVIAISPPTGYTVPSAGSEVLLHNGDPFGTVQAQPPSFIPMMRQTSVVIDQAGNIWSINNWKPDFDIDVAVATPAVMASSFSSDSRHRLVRAH